jgi:hypothetical protein
MHRVLICIASLLLGLTVLAPMGGCGGDPPAERYQCSCDVTCGQVKSTTSIVLCESGSDTVPTDSVESCKRQATCINPVCTCTCNRSGGC